MNRKSTPSSSGSQEAELADRIHSAAIHLLRRLRRVDEASGQSPARLSALSVLVFGGPKSIGALAEAEQVRPPTITRMVKELEAEGLVRREPIENDKRVVCIRATAKATQLLKKGRMRRLELLTEWLEAERSTDRDTLRDAVIILERIVRS